MLLDLSETVLKLLQASRFKIAATKRGLVLAGHYFPWGNEMH